MEDTILKIAVTGPRGRLGQELLALSDEFVECEADITDFDGLEYELNEINPDALVNCAAFTDVDGAEEKLKYREAISVNTRGISNILEISWFPVVHISTDYVFDCRDGPYSEADVPKNPVNAYGYSKWGGEIMCSLHQEARKPVTIVRTTGLFGGISGKPDFVSAVLSHLEEGKVFVATLELRGNQTYTPFLAEGILKYIKSGHRYDVLHIASGDIITRADFAVRIAERFGYDTDLISTAFNYEIPNWKANRPSYGGLCTDRAGDFGVPIYSTAEGLDAYFQAKS